MLSLRARRVLQAGIVAAVCAVPVILPGLAHASPVAASGNGRGHCSPGARTLAPAGSHLYPDTGNGGYLSRHTSVYLVYRASTNRFLAGNHVVLTDVATQCLTGFSLDFERTSANKSAGPNLKLGSVTVNGQPATVRFAQPAYPGDPPARTTRTRPRTRPRRPTRSAVRSTTRCRRPARRSCRPRA